MARLPSTKPKPTLGDYRALALRAYGEGSQAVAYFDRKIRQSPMGAGEPVLAAESQMLALLASLGR
jgi:hypothetical protein